MGLLLDFYGAMLTPHQRALAQLYHNEDLSLGEIAEQLGISRQAVHDGLRRCERSLLDWEERLQLVRRHEAERAILEQAASQLRQAAERLAALEDVAAGRRQELGEARAGVLRAAQMLESLQEGSAEEELPAG